MKKFFQKMTALFLFLMSSMSFAFSEQDLVSKLRQIQTIHGNFTQQHFLKALPQPITTKGDFVLDAQKGLLWQMKTPFETRLRVTPNGITQWNGSQWVNMGNIAQSQQVSLFLGLLSGDLTALKSQFDLALTGVL